MDLGEVRKKLDRCNKSVRGWQGGNPYDATKAGEVRSTLDTILESVIPQDLRNLATRLQTELSNYQGQVAKQQQKAETSPSVQTRPGSRPSVSRQRDYTNITIGDTLEISNAEKSRNGNDLTKPLGGGKRVFIKNYDGRLSEGWTGKVKVTEQSRSNRDFYTAEPLIEAAQKKAPEVPKPSAQSYQPSARDKAPHYDTNRGVPKQDTIEAKVATPLPAQVEVEKPKVATEYTISLGDLGATDAERATVYVDQKALGMPVTEAIAYLIRNGRAASPQSESILDSLKAHLDSGRPIYEVAGSIPDTKKTLGQYLKDWDSGMEIEIGQKPSEVKPPASVEIVDTPKSRSGKAAAAASVPAVHTPSKSRSMPVSTGGRPGGGAYDSLDMQVRDFYRK